MNKSITIGVDSLRKMFTLTEGQIWQVKAARGFLVKILSLKNGVEYIRCLPDGTEIGYDGAKTTPLDFVLRYQQV
ncbi:MAG: hypothetical protein PHT40_03945 [Patescibacteria group bacterium]|nr:hypothetical protein [Patescibacteria group bacterium]